MTQKDAGNGIVPPNANRSVAGEVAARFDDQVSKSVSL